MIKLNRKYLSLKTNKTRYFFVTGGRASSKSFSTALIQTAICIEEPQKILFTRYTMASAHLSIIPEFVEKIDLLNAGILFHINKDEINNISNGASIIFRGIKTSSGDQTANLKSLQGVSTWILDEGEELTDEVTFDKIDLSIRTSGIQNRIIILMNSTTKEHFLYKRFFEDAGVQEGFNGIKGDVTYIHTTYLDNLENLDESFLKQVEQMRINNPEKYNHIMLGRWLNKSEGVIFSNWEVGDFDNSLPNVYGQDYGFSVDPSTLINTAIDKKKKIIYLDECFYKVGLTTSEIEIENKAIAGNKLIIADSSEPRLIEELKRKGINIKGAVKGAGSISGGIALMQDYKIIVTPRSVNLMRELNNYSWNDKKSGTPKDLFNHGLDAARYSVTYQNENVEFKRNKPIIFKSIRR